MKIKVDKEKCSGCHLCEMVCSLAHLGHINVERSAIRVEKDDLGSASNTPVVCRQCKKMACLSGEQVGAATEKKRFVWPKMRAERCPFGALNLFEDSAYHCDVCRGDPQCVKVCTPRAITFKEED